MLAKFLTNASGILFCWRDNSSFRCYTLGLLCLWQCFIFSISQNCQKPGKYQSVHTFARRWESMIHKSTFNCAGSDSWDFWMGEDGKFELVKMGRAHNNLESETDDHHRVDSGEFWMDEDGNFELIHYNLFNMGVKQMIISQIRQQRSLNGWRWEGPVSRSANPSHYTVSVSEGVKNVHVHGNGYWRASKCMQISLFSGSVGALFC